MRVPFAAVVLGWAAVGLVQGVSSAAAQLRGPAVPPPADFTGMQFIDQTGCLFLRAGHGASTVWVPMVNDQHKAICGLTPTTSAPASRSLVVQIGAYAVPANATAASVSITALGLAAGSNRAPGKNWQIVYAGPFPSRAEAKAALSQLVAAGYRDAFIR